MRGSPRAGPVAGSPGSRLREGPQAVGVLTTAVSRQVAARGVTPHARVIACDRERRPAVVMARAAERPSGLRVLDPELPPQNFADTDVGVEPSDRSAGRS